MTNLAKLLNGSQKTLLITIHSLYCFEDHSTKPLLENIAFNSAKEIVILQSYNLIVLTNDNVPNLTSVGFELAKVLSRETRQDLIQKSPTNKSYSWHNSKTNLVGGCYYG